MPVRTARSLEESVLEGLQRGVSTRDVATQSGLEIRTVRAIAHRNGRSELIPSVCPHPPRKEAFSRIDAEMAYWAGFLFADGCVRPSCNLLTIKLQVGDIDQLRKLARFLGCPDRPVYVRKSTTRGKAHKHAVLSLRSADLVSDLIGWGVIPRKGRVDCAVHLDLAETGAFWRGFIDGDGSVTFDPFGAPVLAVYNSSRSLLGQYTCYVAAVLGDEPQVVANRSIATVNLHGTRARKVLEAVNDATPAGLALARKQERVERALRWRSQRESQTQRNVRIARAYAAGERVSLIADREDVTRKYVRKIAAAQGVPQRSGRGGALAIRRPDVIEVVLRGYVTDEPLANMGRRLNCSRVTIWRIAGAAGLPMRGPGGWRSRRDQQQLAASIVFGGPTGQALRGEEFKRARAYVRDAFGELT